jgi:serine/threonine-protein kinase
MARRLDQQKAAELPGTDGAVNPFFSPDGRWVAFTANGRLSKVSAEGGPVIPLCDAPLGNGGNWGEDDNIIVANRFGLSRVPASGGKLVKITDSALGAGIPARPQILPGAKAVLFTAALVGGRVGDTRIEVLNLGTGQIKTVQRDGIHGQYVSKNGDGYLTYINRGTLFAVPFNLASLEVHGAPSQVLNQVVYSVNGLGTAQIAFSQSGTFVYRSDDSAGGLVTVQWIDRTGKMQPLLAKPGNYLYPRLSPDGNLLAMQNEGEIWLYDWRRETPMRLTSGGSGTAYPLWTPDGRYVVFHDEAGMSWTRSDGASQPQSLTKGSNLQVPWSFTPDGKTLGFIELAPQTSYDLMTVPIEYSGSGLRAGKPEKLLATLADERYLSFSPDGRWIAYSSTVSGIPQIFVRSFPDDGSQAQVSFGGGRYPRWSRITHELFFRAEDGRIMVVNYKTNGNSFIAEKPPRLWSDKQTANLSSSNTFDLAPDGKRVAALMPVAADNQRNPQNRVIFLLNFTDEIRRRVGALQSK